jgi:hypothetical protein
MRHFKFLGVILLAVGLSGCAMGSVNSPDRGLIFTAVKGPITSTPYPATATAKVGTSSSACVFGLFSFGDASIHSAIADGGITKVQHIDYQYVGFLGLFSTYKVIVYGE